MGILQSCKAEVQHINSDDAHITYAGRHSACNTKNHCTTLYWPGSGASITFEGTDAAVQLKDETGQNYYYCIVDGKNIQKIKPDTGLKTYEVAHGLAKGPHTLELVRLTEAKWGKTHFYGFDISKNGRLLAMQQPKRKIEFYGNSITCAYGVDDSTGDSGNAEFENNYYSYAAITARHFGAGYSCIAKSGIGLMLSWFPIIMPEMYDRLDPDDSLSKWDFKNYTPDVVVVDLLQNDSWLVKKPEHQQFRARFGNKAPDDNYIVEAYKNFITSLRSKYPRATIICCLGCMDAAQETAPWMGYISTAAAQMRDDKVLTYRFTYTRARTHPKRKDQQIMADGLISFIDNNVKW